MKNFNEVIVELARKLENQYIGREDVELYLLSPKIYLSLKEA